jgi:ATP phosphoribosyltransferase regulatory subunit
MSDVRVIDAVLADVPSDPVWLSQVHAALAGKDQAELDALSAHLPAKVQSDLRALPTLFGGVEVLDVAQERLTSTPRLQAALDNLRWLSAQVQGMDVSIDLADLRGYAYYTGMRFSIFGAAQAQATPVELVRGGRYDNVGEVFGRQRPAAGFSLDLKELVAVLPQTPQRLAIRAPWGGDAALRNAIAQLRAQGETVVCVLPGHEHEVQEFQCDRAMAQRDGAWVVQPLQS